MTASSGPDSTSRFVTAEIIPRNDTGGCEAPGCSTEKLLAEIDPEDDSTSRVLCPEHRVKFLREVSN
jgi:hypothetical protein